MRLDRVIELGAWAIGLSLLSLYGGARLWIEGSRADDLAVLRAEAAAATVGEDGAGAQAPDSLPAALNLDSVDQSLWSAQRIRAFAASLAEPGAPKGVLSIPSLRLEVPIYAGATELNLNRGAAHIEGTAPLGPSGNVGLAAHRDGFFRSLERIRLGAEVVLEVHGRSLHYRVVDLAVVKPTDVHVLAPGPIPSVTLVTCYPFYFVGNAPERYIVRAELVDSAGGVAVRAGPSPAVSRPLFTTNRKGAD